MDNMEQMQHFTRVLKVQTRMLLDASAGGTIRNKSEYEVSELIENMCQNEYHTQSERSPRNKCMMELDT